MNIIFVDTILRVNLFDRFEQNTVRYPDKPAFIYLDRNSWRTLTYRDIYERTGRFLRGLEAGPCSPGFTSALMTPPSVDFFPFALALLKRGIIPIVLDPAIGLKNIGKILEESKPDVFIGNALTHVLRMAFGWGKNSVKHNLSIAKIESGKPARGKAEVWKADPRLSITNYRSLSPAAVVYTSGSTGLPKGAVYTHDNLAAQLDLLRNAFRIAPDEIDLPAFPLYALIDLLLGVTSVIPDISFPAPAKTDPEKVISAIRKFNVTNMFASPAALDILENWWSRHAARRLPSLKRVVTAGAPATISLQRRFRRVLEDHTSLFGIYGATETLPIAMVESRDIFSLEGETENGAGICLGWPIEGVTVRILPISDEPIQEWQDSLEAGKNVVGEITVQSPATTRTYVGGIADPIHKIHNGGEIIHRTGDVGYFDDAGRLWYCGRKSHRVVTRTGVMFTEQVENIFNAHPLVYRTALVGVGGAPVLWVELEGGVRANKDKIRRELMKLARNHPQASTIQEFLFMKKFPTDVRHNSKIIREQLAAMAKNRISNH